MSPTRWIELTGAIGIINKVGRECMTEFYGEEGNEDPGISFDMESDEMDEDVEELNFDAEEWGEEAMDVDL